MALISNSSIVNSGFKYSNGNPLVFSGQRLISIRPGSCRDSTNTYDITNNQNILINCNIVGANGIDENPIEPTTIYAVYIIGDSTKNRISAGILSKNYDSPSLPFGYDMFNLLGFVRTGTGSNIVTFLMNGRSNDRAMYYIVFFQELTNGSSSLFTPVDLSPSVPPLNTIVFFDVTLNASASSALVEFIPFGSSASNGIIKFGYGVAGTQIGSIGIPCGLNGNIPSIQYRVSAGSTVSLRVYGYLNISKY